VSWQDLLDGNRRWAAERTTSDPELFTRVASEHRPKALFIGCSDARVPANLVTDTDLGELFVHRNIANQVHATDASLSAALQYAIEVLGVEDVIVCGHHGCGGVRAALSQDVPDAVDSWISPIRMLSRVHQDELDAREGEDRVDHLVDLNVKEQVAILKRHPSVRAAWAAGRDLRVHGWVYDLPSGLLQPRVRLEGPEKVQVDELVVVESSSGVGAQAK
jgi:carbonic anhydrase